jgi:hypothetical protein
VTEILASREVPAQDQKQGDLSERTAQTVDRKLLDILDLRPPKQILSQLNDLPQVARQL